MNKYALDSSATWVWKRVLISGYTDPDIREGTERVGGRFVSAVNIARGGFCIFYCERI